MTSQVTTIQKCVRNNRTERKHMQLKHIALVLVSGLVFAGCIPGTNETQQNPDENQVMEESQINPDEQMMDGTSELVDDEAMMAQGQVVSLLADDFTFGVEEVRVKQGEKLTLSVTNSHGFHDLVIDELGVNSGMIPEGETMDIEIPTDQPGTYEYYCSVGQHRELGMKGTLIIE